MKIVIAINTFNHYTHGMFNTQQNLLARIKLIEQLLETAVSGEEYLALLARLQKLQAELC